MLPIHAMLKLAGAVILISLVAGVSIAGLEVVPQWAQYVMWVGVACTFAGLLIEPAAGASPGGTDGR